eukprot:7286349-Lingulodinium_polyedra.AAC.1
MLPQRRMVTVAYREGFVGHAAEGRDVQGRLCGGLGVFRCVPPCGRCIDARWLERGPGARACGLE